MKCFLPFLFALICFNLSAQSKWSIGLVGGVDFAKTSEVAIILTDVNGQPIPVQRKFLVVPRYGANVEFRINNKLSLKSGIRYNVQGRRYSYGDLGGTIVSIESIFKNRFIEVPLHLKVIVSNGKWNYFLEGGISPNVYLNSDFRDELGNGEVFESDAVRIPDYKSITGSLDFGFGLEREINDNISISMQPMFRYYLLAEEAIFGGNFYNIGLEAGASYSFGK